jgi:LytS/YehU family sensor histidine kinase
MGFGAAVNGIIGLVMKGFISWYGDIRVKAALNQKNVETELALVKSQLNPHFLFNTINNIDVLITIDPIRASVYLNQLSDIMRFMLYETKTADIALAKELAYIEKYIALQKIRTSNPDAVSYIVAGDPGAIRIAPMLFMPFIENAFKHAESNKTTSRAIAIYITIEDDTTCFECENIYTEGSEVMNNGGLGNDLITKRLHLLYPHTHLLEIIKQNNIYKIKLVIRHHADQLHHC